MSNQFHDYTAGWQHHNITDPSHSYYEVNSSYAPSLDARTLPHPPPQHSTTTYPPPYQRKDCSAKWLTIVESASIDMNRQSVGYQGYVPTTLVFPPSQPMPIMENTHHPRMDGSSYAMISETSFPTIHTPNYNPYCSSSSSASSGVSEFVSFDQAAVMSGSEGKAVVMSERDPVTQNLAQVPQFSSQDGGLMAMNYCVGHLACNSNQSISIYQTPSSAGHSYEYSYRPWPVASAGSDVVWQPSTGQPNTHAFNDNGAGYYNPGYNGWD